MKSWFNHLIWHNEIFRKTTNFPFKHYFKDFNLFIHFFLNFICNRFQTVDGITLVLTLWMDKILEERENLQETFEKFQFYIDHFKPTAQIEPEYQEKMLTFLNRAYECHLNLDEKPEDEVHIWFFH